MGEAKIDYEFKVFDGKYTFKKYDQSTDLHILRHGEEWVHFKGYVSVEGGNAFARLVDEHAEALKALREIRDACTHKVKIPGLQGFLDIVLRKCQDVLGSYNQK